MPRRALAPAALVIALAVATWLISGVGLFDIVRFIGYEIGFIALPGAAALWAIRGRRSGFLVTIALGWPLGQTLEILAFVATAATGMRSLFVLYPIAVLGASAALMWRARHSLRVDETAEHMSLGSMWTAAAAVSLGLIYLALMYLPQVPLPSSTRSVAYNVDFVFFIGLVGQALHHWPLTSPGLAGVPLHYEWFIFLHMAAVSQVTHVSIPVIALRLNYVPTMVVLGCQLIALGRSIGGDVWIGVLAIAGVFLLGPLDLTTNSGGAPFVESFSYHLWASWTISFGLMFFLALIYLINERLQTRTWWTGNALRAWVVIAVLMVGASGAKATILPVVIAGTALYMIVALVARRGSPWNAFIALVLCIIVFASTFLIVYGSGVPGTSVDPFVSLAGTLPVVAATGIASSLVRHLVLPFAYAAGVAGVLLPLAGAFYMVRRRHRGELTRYALCICLFAAGLVISSLVHQISFSEQYFLDTGFVAGCIVAAAGMRLAWLDLGGALPISKRATVIAFASSLALLLAVVGSTSVTMVHEDAIVVRYLVLGAMCVGIVLGWRLLARARLPSTSGVLALGLVPLLAASALTSPILVAPAAKKLLTGLPVTTTVPDPQEAWGLTPGLLAALDWIRQHTPLEAVVAVSNHWINPAETDGRNYYYSAFSERQVFVEAYDPIRFGVAIGSASSTERMFVYRQELNNQVFGEADAQSLRLLTRQYSVRFLFIDRLHGKVDLAVVRLGHVVFANQDAIVVAVA